MANYIKGTAIQENSISETKLDSSLQSWKETVTNHINNNDNPHNITKSSIGLDNVTNDAQVKRSELGVANGVATLDSTGKVPSGQLPSYVDDVIEGYLYNGVFYKDTSYTTSIVGESGKIYIDLPTNKTYRWTGSVYGVISETIALGETSSTAYRGDRGKIAYDHSQSAHAPSNAQANVIETIKVNGTILTPNSKAVDITIPTVGNGTITIKQGGTSKGTFTTNQNSNTTIELTDTNTTYTAGDGLSLNGTTFSNNGVRSIATGTTNGTISVNTNGNISNIGVYGLKSAAYTNSSDYAAASHTHSYLPLSGGTLTKTGTEDIPLVLKTSCATTWLNFQTSDNKNRYLGVSNENKLCFQYDAISYMVLHSGNYNSYALPLSGGTMANTNVVTNLNADLLDGYHADSFTKKLYLGTTDLNSIGDSLLGQQSGNVNATTELHYPVGEAGGLISILSAYDSTNQIYGTFSSNRWFARGAGTGLSSRTSWREFAFLDSNVASATKLQNSRTIWGQSFDGTGNVSGALTGVTSITASGHTKVTSLKTSNICIECDDSGNTAGHTSEINNYSRPLYIQYSTSNNCCICYGGGNVGIGITSPTYKLHVSGDARIDGTISCIKLSQTSDIKYKTNIKQIEYEEALKIIENLNPVTWDWNENTKISGSSSGFIAQEVKDIIPNAVSESDENTLSLDYT